MPTARPIIIEKFIDHTDSGVAIPSRCRSANPTAMPGQGEQERQERGDHRAEREEQAGSSSGRR